MKSVFIDKHQHIKKPVWLRKTLPAGPAYEQLRSLINKKGLHTVCQEAKCPNIWECFSNNTATFLIMGSKCTRNCRFCAIEHNIPDQLDPNEPNNVANAAQDMNLEYVVITSVTRDDIHDGGASFFAQTINSVRQTLPYANIEVLIPDFQGSIKALSVVLDACPDVLNHNIETVETIYTIVRPQALYLRSLKILQQAKKAGVITKSGIMLGLGENSKQVYKTLADLFESGCDILTIGQYLQPTKQHLCVKKFISPDEFDEWKRIALQIGFLQVTSGPFVRSSFNAKDSYKQACLIKNKK